MSLKKISIQQSAGAVRSPSAFRMVAQQGGGEADSAIPIRIDLFPHREEWMVEGQDTDFQIIRANTTLSEARLKKGLGEKDASSASAALGKLLLDNCCRLNTPDEDIEGQSRWRLPNLEAGLRIGGARGNGKVKVNLRFAINSLLGKATEILQVSVKRRTFSIGLASFFDAIKGVLKDEHEEPGILDRMYVTTVLFIVHLKNQLANPTPINQDYIDKTTYAAIWFGTISTGCARRSFSLCKFSLSGQCGKRTTG